MQRNTHKQIYHYNEPSFKLSNRLARFLWSIVSTLFFRYTPSQLFLWRNLLLNLFGADIHLTCHIYPRAKIWAPWNLKMSPYSCLANDVICYSQDKITLGKRAIVSQGSHLCSGSHDYNSKEFTLITNSIVLEDDCWICAEAFVGPGVTIKEGAVLGARAVTFKDLDAWSVYTGNPATYVKQRKVRY